MSKVQFEETDDLFRQDKLNDLVADPDGLRFLKLRAMSRPEYLKRLFRLAGQEPPDIDSRQLLSAAFKASISLAQIEECAREIYREAREQRRVNEAELVNQLYRVQEFNWGGFTRTAWKEQS